MNTRYILLVLVFYFNSIQFCIGLDARAFQGCALVNRKIFCYGGYNADPNNSEKTVAVTTHLVMDLTSIDFNNLTHTTQPWANVSTTMQQQLDYTLETRSRFEIATVDNSSYVIHGGCLDPGCRTMLRNATILYNTNTNTWKTLESPPYTIIHSGMVYSRGAAFMWGGNLANDTNEYAPNVMFSLEMNSDTAKFLDQITWILSPLGVGTNIPNITRTGHSATLLEDGRIFYLGGALGTRKATDSDKYAVMDHATIFDTTKYTWDVRNINGIKIAPRKFHTATAVKGTNVIVIYGGIQSDDALENAHNFIKETCVLFDTRALTYSNLQYDNGDNFPGRYGHSAIIYNSYLFLLFGINGINGQHVYANDVTVMDFADVNHPIWLGNISDVKARPTKTTNESTTDLPTPPFMPPASPESSGGLSSGGIAGVSVGCAIAGVRGKKNDGIGIRSGGAGWSENKQKKKKKNY
ncbi:hypothetical protein BCR42DRAFT_198433 [Absidia repens]|uniref:Galactose oxidase n=1 Tax=Absidia repens TaxID=90262 RepID=A0A1X2HX38_9FUNG|nr:hypothetical protein BCR42DRAFT_198433 [Absidia repens]